MAAPPPPKESPREITEIEEDRIILRPIGPGVQTLEPDNMSTLGRPTTPAFPVSPASSVGKLFAFFLFNFSSI